MLNYQDIKIFNKNGYEIPLVSTSNIMFTTTNNLDMISDNDILLYGYYDNVDKTKFSTKTIKPGKLNKDSYNTAISSGIKLYAFVDEKLVNETTVLLSENNFIKLYYTDNTEYNYSDDTLIANGKDEFLYYTLDTNICIDININLSHDKNGDEISLAFPSAIFFANIDFEKVSVGLVETETLIFGTVDKENNELIYKPLVDNNINGYDLKLVIDGSSDELSFLTYDVLSEEISRHSEDFIPCNENNESQYSNIGFFPDKEGVYENIIHVCLIKRDTNDVIPIGQLNITCAAEGEDERYNALLANFGLQHPKTYYNIFKEHDIDEHNINWELINKKSKELFLTYDQIFPYIGTYKALINAVEYLGYNDIYFREWYKKLNDNKHISYRIDLNDIFKESDIKHKQLDINYKKLNKLSMIYKLNSETGEFDKFNIPIVENCYNYSISAVLTKLIALKDWLHRNIISVNCKITDITGEGVVYEKINTIAYGTIMQNIEYEDVIELSPRLKNHTVELEDGSANIEITTMIKSDDNCIQLDDINDLYISNFDEKSTIEYPYLYDFHVKATVDTSNTIISDNIDKAIWLNDGQLYITNKYDKKQLKLDAQIDNENSQLYTNGDELYVSITGYFEKTAKFIKAPIIQLESGYLRNCISDWSENIEYTIDRSNNSKYSYMIYDVSGNTQFSNDYILLYPLNDAELSYTLDNIYDVPLFKLKNYQIICYNFENNRYSTKNIQELKTDYILDIRDGKIISKSDNLTCTLNFNYEYNKENKQNITAVYEYNETFSYDNINEIYKKLNVKHIGHYNIMVYAYKNGNICACDVINGCDVIMPLSEIKLITDTSMYENNMPYHYNGIVYGEEYNNLIIDDYYNNSLPLFRPQYINTNLTFEKDHILYPNITYANDIADKGDYINFINNLDKLKFYDFDSINSSIKFTYNKLYNKYNNKVNLVVYNKMLLTGIEEYNATINLNNNKEITLQFDNDNNDYSKLYKNITELYKDDYNIEYYIIPIDEYDVSINNDNSISINNIEDANNIYNIGDIIKIFFYKNNNIVGNTSFKITQIDSSIISVDGAIIKNTDFEEIKISHAHQAYTKYILNAKESKEYNIGVSKIWFEQNRIYNYLDNTFGIIISKFNHLNAYNLWNMEQYKIDIDVDPFNYILGKYGEKIYIHPNTLNFVYIDDGGNYINYYNTNVIDDIDDDTDDTPSDNKKLYSYTKPITLSKTKDNILYITAESNKIHNIRTYWKIYKQNINNNTRTLLFELMNNVLQLKIKSPGVYDIEAYSYDSNGNLSVSKQEAMIYIK